jgi:hypothetical protein
MTTERSTLPGTAPRPYQIVGERIMPEAPTLQRLFDDLRSHGTDRGALVRHATLTEEAGLCVVLLTNDAAADLGPTIIEAAEKITDRDERHEFPGLADDESSVVEIFRLMDADKIPFLWGSVGPDRTPPMVAFFVSQEVCEWLAPRLTAKRCPCSLV